MTTRIVLIVLAIVLVIGVIVGVKSCTTVPAGNVGVRFNLYGGDKGVNNEVVGPGRYFLSINEHMYLFPTFQQTYTYTRSATEGKQVDESFTFQTKEQLEVGADIGVTFHIEKVKAAVLFQTFQRGLDEIMEGPMRNMIRDAFNRVGSTTPMDSVSGDGKIKLLDAVQVLVKEYFASYGIIVDKMFLVSSFRLPNSVVASINSKIEAVQLAQKRQNEVAESIADANKKIAIARGDSASKVIAAAGEAQAIRLKQQALSDLIIRYETIQKWDGVLPTVTGGNIPMLQLPASAMSKNK